MALKIRLRQQGRTNRTVYRVVVTDCRSARDGKYLEMLGWYNPVAPERDETVFVKADRVQHWLDLGAQMTDNVHALLKKVAPSVVKRETEKTLARRAKAAAKRKTRKAAA
jgi:small subunit ribosomal protein S16